MRARLWALLGAACAFGVFACYNPAIGEGDFLCGQGGKCPTQWKCGPDNRCYKTLPAFDGGGIGDGPARDTVVGPVPDVNPQVDAAGCNRGLTCSPGAAAGACDPVCQSGCACDSKCSFIDGKPTCVLLRPAPLEFFAECKPGEDLCRAGSVCAAERRPLLCGAHCYRACRTNADCGPQSRCNEEYLDPNDNVLTKLCSPPIEPCNPVGLNPTCGTASGFARPAPAFGCYLLDAGREESAVCDCAGTLDVGQPCTERHECKPGIECLPDAQGVTLCRRLCSLEGGPGMRIQCPLGQTCRPLGNSIRIGACL